jgi:microcystin-dependent protein
MASPYVGEIRLFAGSFAPSGWMTCDGQLLPISQYDTLFNLIGTTYGGDGQQTFALPNLSARLPIHMGNNRTSTYTIGESGGVDAVTLTTNQMPAHSHPLVATTNAGNATSPRNAIFAASSANQFAAAPASSPVAPDGFMHAGIMGTQGGSQPHDNMHPYLAITYIISLFGIYPSP